MAVHMVKIISGPPSGVTLPTIRGAVDTWLDRHERTLTTEERAVRRYEASAPGDWPDRVSASFRFTLASDKTPILDQAEAAIATHVPWYLIGHHFCVHDGDGGDCTWGETRTHGPVPAEVSL